MEQGEHLPVVGGSAKLYSNFGGLRGDAWVSLGSEAKIDFVGRLGGGMDRNRRD